MSNFPNIKKQWHWARAVKRTLSLVDKNGDNFIEKSEIQTAIKKSKDGFLKNEKQVGWEIPNEEVAVSRNLPGVVDGYPTTIDVMGNTMWLALREGNAVYRMELDKGTIHHVAGTGKKGFTGNGGPAQKATLSGPKGIAIGPNGNIYLADTESHSVRMIDLKTGKLKLIAGDGKRGDGPEGQNLKKCRMDRLHGIFVDKDGSIYIGDTNTNRIRVIRP